MSALNDITIFSTQENFRTAFDEQFTKDLDPHAEPGDIIFKKSMGGGLNYGITLEDSNSSEGKLDFFMGSWDGHNCAVYSEIENIRREIWDAIQRRENSVIIPYVLNTDPMPYVLYAANMHFFKAHNIETSPGYEIRGYSDCKNCTINMPHGIQKIFYDTILKEKFEELLSTAGCSISYGTTITQKIRGYTQTELKELPSFKITFALEGFGLFPRQAKIEQISVLVKFVLPPYQSGEQCDVTIQAKDGEIKAHKLALALCSPYIRALLFSCFKEAKEERIDNSEFSRTTIIAALDAIYKGENPFDSDPEHTIDPVELLMLGNKWLIPSLKSYAANELVLRTDENEAEALGEYGEKYDTPYLVKVSRFYQEKLAKMS